MSWSRTFRTGNTLTRQSAAQALWAINGSNTVLLAARPAFVGLQHSCAAPKTFSSSRHAMMKEFFPEPDAPNVRRTKATWPHPVYSESQMKEVIVAHRDAETWSDWVALSAIRTMRWCFDLATGYRHGAAVKLNEKDPAAAQARYGMTERKYMIRNVFLESIAGVPGSVAGIVRHLHSMRRMKRDNGWIETLLEESYNERMHLLTFLKMSKPGPFMRLMVLGAQGVFFNAFFLAYILAPRICHRFVGYLEEEAVLTYTREIEDIDAGLLPNWAKMQAPDIAVQYWNMPEGHQSMRDLLLYVRADESKHREVNHTLGNLDQKNDPNPYASEYVDDSHPHPVKDLRYQKPEGWSRQESI